MYWRECEWCEKSEMGALITAEDERDAEIARRALAEIAENPDTLVQGIDLRGRLVTMMRKLGPGLGRPEIKG